MRVVDISTHKTSVLNFKCRSVYSRVLDAIKCVEKMLEQWSACCDVLYGVKKATYSNKYCVLLTHNDYLQCPFLLKLHREVDTLARSSLDDITDFQAMLKPMITELENYREVSRSKPYTGSKSFVIDGNFFDVDLLCLVLEKLKFDPPQFLTTNEDNELSHGKVQLNIPKSPHHSHPTVLNVAAYCPMSSL